MTTEKSEDKIEFVTSVNHSYHAKYGVALMLDFLTYADKDITFRVYCDASLESLLLDDYVLPPGAVGFDLGMLPGVASFIEDATAKTVAVRGSAYSTDPDTRLDTAGYDYRNDVVTWGKKALSLSHALLNSEARFLFWVDADCLFRRAITRDWLISLFDGAGIACFQREWPHTETGFIGFDLRAMGVPTFSATYATYWHGRRIFSLDDWTDCHAFDASINIARDSGLVVQNLSTTPKGHVIAASPVGEYIDHQKGKRKQKRFEQNKKGIE